MIPFELNMVRHEDCLDTLKQIPDNSIDSIVTDPPYGLGKEPDALEMLRDWLEYGHQDVKGKGFMGQEWDAFVPQPQIWKECLRVLKPGGYLLSFAGTRTCDLVVLGLRIAGFEIRDQIAWTYGSGFPKSLDVSKALDKMAGAEREVIGIGFSGAMLNGNGQDARPWHENKNENGQIEYNITAPATDAAKQWQGWGTALKPAFEPIVVARKPLSGTVAENVLQWGTGGINVDGCRVGTSGTRNNWTKSADDGYQKNDIYGKRKPMERQDYNAGRFPANFIHDGSEAVEALFPESAGQQGDLKNHNKNSISPNGIYGAFGPKPDAIKRDDAGSAARFFYCAKATSLDRDEGIKSNRHPTVKPTSLMRWLCRLVTPPVGIVYDPFAGSGSTGKAAILEEFQFIGSDLEEEYVTVANARIQYAIKNRAELNKKYSSEMLPEKKYATPQKKKDSKKQLEFDL